MVSWLLYDTRKKKRLTQEAVCAGICNKGTLSRMESGKSRPSYTQTRALFGRLGKQPPRHLVPLTKEELELLRISRFLHNVPDKKNWRYLQGLEQFRARMPQNDMLRKQEYQALYAEYVKWNTRDTKEALELYEKALRITVPDFSLTSNLDGRLYNFMELSLIECISNTEYYIHDGAAAGYKTDAFKKNAFLKDYIERNIEEFEEEYLYSTVVFDMTNWTGLEGRYEEALSLAERGIELAKKCISFSHYYGQLFNKAYILIAMGRGDEARPFLRQYMTLKRINDPHNEIEFGLKELKRRFGFEL